MASLFRPIAVKPVPRNAVIKTVDGKQFATWTNLKHKEVMAELTPDGKKCRLRSPTWWIELTDASGKPSRKKGFTDRKATFQLAAALERHAEDVRSGRDFPRGRAELMIDHVPTFREHLERKGTSAKHVENTIKQIRDVLTGAALTTPGAVDRNRVERWLDGQQRAHGWSARTRNQWAGALSQFGRWLVRERLSNFNPFDGLVRQNVAIDRRHVRRVLAPEDLNRLVVAARGSNTFQGLTGVERAWLYKLAAYTGRRVGALKQMSRSDIRCDSTGLPVSITTSARLQKSRKEHTVPVHSDLARDLGAWLATRPERGPIFNGWKTWADRGAELVRHDLATAREAWIREAADPVEESRRRASDRLKYKDNAGEVFDFHAFRGQFVTALALAGVPLSAAQQLADHSDPKLTANVYTRWSNHLASEIAKLPPLGVCLSPDSGNQ